ncbi:MAG: PilZ domain-containing protein [Planctomycetota bacterium]|nr:PilZ domain-containing protein [Planctomycetota bacterium]
MAWFKSSPKSQGPNARKFGRVLMQGVTCSLGEVLDLSASGMRVRTPGKPELPCHHQADITLTCVDGEVVVRVESIWERRTGWSKHEIGVRFLELTDQQRSMIGRTGRTCASNETIAEDVRRWRESA